MVIRDAEVCHVGPYFIETNASWVKIKHKGKTVFKRTPDMNTWYDPAHKKIVDAIRTLEEAIIEAATSGCD